MTDLERKLHELIEALGPTEETALAKLRELGVKGYRRDPCECVFARYFDQGLGLLLPQDGEVQVCGLWSSKPALEVRSVIGRVPTLVLPFPRHLERVAREFDRGEYPELVAQRVE